eukprot:3400019-Prymnesium_polylepis.2
MTKSRFPQLLFDVEAIQNPAQSGLPPRSPAADKANVRSFSLSPEATSAKSSHEKRRASNIIITIFPL